MPAPDPALSRSETPTLRLPFIRFQRSSGPETAVSANLNRCRQPISGIAHHLSLIFPVYPLKKPAVVTQRDNFLASLNSVNPQP
ncbi:hypothetical protein [Pantoea sp. Ep11b]|uniref:hypothetical protein n=1 Tax=unclassified Pantoea TaxID=2630326 RepID=UPI00345F4A61